MYATIHQRQFYLQPNRYYRRIISLVPSQTELLASLGLDEQIVGITKYCVHPAGWLQTKATVGGTKKQSFEKIKSLQPDLIIANKEENTKDQIEAASELCPIYVSEVNDLATALEMILQVGLLANAKLQAEALVQQIAFDFEKLESKRPKDGKSVAYLIWRKPYIAVGGGTFIDDMLQRCSLQNVFADKKRYPTVTDEQLQEANPQVILLSSEPFPFQQKHVEELQTYLPHSLILLVNGELFSWYGSRMLQAVAYFSKWVTSSLNFNML